MKWSYGPQSRLCRDGALESTVQERPGRANPPETWGSQGLMTEFSKIWAGAYFEMALGVGSARPQLSKNRTGPGTGAENVQEGLKIEVLGFNRFNELLQTANHPSPKTLHKMGIQTVGPENHTFLTEGGGGRSLTDQSQLSEISIHDLGSRPQFKWHILLYEIKCTF